MRTAFGQTGNLSVFGAKFTSLSPANINGLGGALLTNVRGVDDIEPETQTEIEAGIDASLASGFASVEFTLNQKKMCGKASRYLRTKTYKLEL